MKRFYTYITLCLLFLSCSDKNNELELALHYAGALTGWNWKRYCGIMRGTA